MYEVKVKSSFSAAHNLRDYHGKCENVHGHNWIVEAAAASSKLNKQGMVIDFTILKKALKDVLTELDHSDLNEHSYFKKVNPSSENIAKFIYDRLKVSSVKCQVSSVTVWETDASCAEYRGD